MYQADGFVSKFRVRIGPLIAGCSSLSESACLGRYNELAKIIHKQTVLKCKIPDINTAL